MDARMQSNEQQIRNAIAAIAAAMGRVTSPMTVPA